MTKVHPLTDRTQIREILQTDRSWSAYALADLEPGYFEHSAWFSSGAKSVLLVYSAFSTPVLIAVGAANDLAPVWDEVLSMLSGKRELYIVVKPDVLPLVERSCYIRDLRPMVRMVLEPKRFHPLYADDIERLAAPDLPKLASLYADGDAAGESPDFFIPQMLETGVYYGIREGPQLVAVAGTHVLAPGESVGGLGNIYTRRDRRGRGFGMRVTSAVTEELLFRRNLQTIALNVRENNLSAIRVYERLGFQSYCPYYEAVAVKRQ